MFKDSYAALNRHIKPSDALVNATINKATSKETAVHRRFAWKPLLVELAVCLLLVGIPVLVATVEPVYELVYAISPQLAHFFRPIKRCAIDNGIKVEVEWAYAPEEGVKLYALVQDLTGNRIDETFRLPYGAVIYAPEKYTCNSHTVSYDEDTKTSTVRITVVDENWKNVTPDAITGDKITLQFQRFTSGGISYSDYKLPVDLSTVPVATKTREVGHLESTVYTCEPGIMDKYDDVGTVLVPTKPEKSVPIDNVYYTNAGYINGRLHVQVAMKYVEYEENYGDVYLMDKDGKTVFAGYDVNTSDSVINEDGTFEDFQHREAVFDIPQSEIGNYNLYMNVRTSGDATEGNWTVTAPVKPPLKPAEE